MIKNIFLYFFILLLIVSCKEQKRQVSIEELTFFNKTFTMNGVTANNRIFVVDGYQNNAIIDSFILKYVSKINDTNNEVCDDYGYTFYSKSKVTNAENLKKNRRDLDRYSLENDLIWMYNWNTKRKIMTSFKIENGKIVNPSSNIEIQDIPNQ